MLKSKKALMSAFFILFFNLSSANAQCLPQGLLTRVAVSKVVDGDTVRLDNGRSVRLLGVNTPELNLGKGKPEPFALEAKMALQGILQGATPGLVLGSESEDRYKRLLGYLVVEHQSTSEYLISQGLGWAVAVEPNTELADCLFEAEARARVARVGIWASPVITAASVRSGGFKLIRGRVTRVDLTSQHLYLELDDQVALRLNLEGLSAERRSELAASEGQSIEARGWIIDRRKQLKSGSRYKPFLLPITSGWHLNIAP